MNWILKKFIAIMLIVVMILTSAGFATLAESIGDVIVVNSETTEPTSDKYYEDVLGDKYFVNAEGEIGSSESTEINDESTTVEEPEEGESTTVEEQENVESITTEKVDDESTTVEESEEGESTTTEKLEEETTTTEKSEEETLATSESASDSAGGSESVEPKDTLESSESVGASTVSPTENPTNVAPVEGDSIGDDTASPSDINSDIDDIEGTSPLATISDVENAEDEINISTVSNVGVKNLNIEIENASKSDANLLGDSPLFGDSLPQYVWFGTYPQNDSTAKEPVKWWVYSQNSSEAVLITDRALTTAKWHHDDTNDLDYLNSDICALAESFKDTLFTNSQKSSLKKTTKAHSVGLASDSLDNNYIYIPSTAEIENLPTYINKYAKGPQSNDNIVYWTRTHRAQTNPDTHVKFVVDPNDTGTHIVYGRYHQETSGVRLMCKVDLTKTAVWNFSNNNTITWNLEGDEFNDESKIWSQMTYWFPNQNLPVTSNFKNTTGRVLNGWYLNAAKTNLYTTTQTTSGPLLLTPEWICDITWSGKDNIWSFKDAALASTSYINGKDYYFPTANQLNIPIGSKLDHWTLKRTGKDDIVTTYIPSDMKEAVTLEPTFKSNIIFSMGGGYLNIATPSQYDIGTGLTLPTVAQVVPPVGREFDHWIIRQEGKEDINPATQISNTSSGDVEIIAVYNNLTYNITWTMNGGSFKVPSEASPSYTYGTNYPLPQRSQIDAPNVYEELDYWTIKQTGKDDIVGATSISNTTYGDIEIVATYRNRKYQITWTLGTGASWNGAAGPAEYTYEEGLSPLPTNVTGPNGREFDHWIIRQEGEEDINPATQISTTTFGPVEMIAVYKNATYQITWTLGNGNTWTSTAGPDNYIYGTGVSSFPQVTPGTIEKQFDYWILRQAGKQDIIRATNISTSTYGPVEMIAVYKNADFAITWNLGAGTWNGAQGADHYTFGTGLTLPTNVTPPEGKGFDHWEIGGVVSTNISKTDTGAKTIVAVYKNLSYNITWNLNGGSFKVPSEASPSYTHGTNYPLPTALKVNAPYGRELDYWRIKKGNTVVIARTTIIPATLAGDIEIVAVYKNKKYKITWTLGTGASWDGVAGPAEYTYGEGLSPLPSNINAPLGKEFDYWTVNGVKVEEIATSAIEPITLVAVYKNKKYQITWTLGDGASWDGKEGPDGYTYGEGLSALPTNVTGPIGRRFDHWSIKQNGTVVIANATSIPATQTGDVEIVAAYTSIQYSITWQLNGASVSGGTPANYTYGVGLTLPAAERVTPATGKVFAYWAVNGAEATNISTTQTGPVTVTLVYEGQEKHHITWDYGTGENAWIFTGYTAVDEYTEGIAFSLPEAAYVSATTDGKEFDYWTVDGVVATEIATTKTTDVTVAAVLKDAEYKITWNLGDGTWKGTAGPNKYTHGKVLSPLPTNVNSPVGRTFSHWSIKQNGTVVIANATSIPATQTGNVEIVAVYTPIQYSITWQLNGASVSGGTPANYAYGEGLTLPVAARVTPATGKVFDYWLVNGTRATKISETQTGLVTVTLVYEGVPEYQIIWQLRNGQFINYNAQETYIYGIGLTLPSAANVVPPNGTRFLFWSVNGEKSTAISTTQTGTVTITAIFTNANQSDNNPSRSGGGGGRGGGGGGRLSASMGQNMAELGTAVSTPLQNYEYVWASANDSKGTIQYFAKVLKTTSLAKALMSSSNYSQYYKDLDENYIQIKNGIYTLQYLNQFYNYAFDYDGNMIVGIVSTTEDAKQFILDVNTGSLLQPGTIGKGKYYFYDGAGELYGVMWNQPITVNNVQYTFDVNGKILTETPNANMTGLTNTSSSGSWKYDPVSDQWKFASTDVNGQMTYYQSGAYPIQSEDGNTHYYVFDDNGNMKTGLTEYQGKTYYLREDGPLRGAVWTGVITLNNKEYVFGDNGELVSGLSKTE